MILSTASLVNISSLRLYTSEMDKIGTAKAGWVGTSEIWGKEGEYSNRIGYFLYSHSAIANAYAEVSFYVFGHGWSEKEN